MATVIISSNIAIASSDEVIAFEANLPSQVTIQTFGPPDPDPVTSTDKAYFPDFLVHGITNISGNCGASTNIIIQVKQDPNFTFTFSLNGSPQINVLGGSPSADIIDGSITTSATNGTYFGVVDEGGLVQHYKGLLAGVQGGEIIRQGNNLYRDGIAGHAQGDGVAQSDFSLFQDARTDYGRYRLFGRARSQTSDSEASRRPTEGRGLLTVISGCRAAGLQSI